MFDGPLIFHIEDNFENRVLVRRLLESEAFRVEEAENATDALVILKTLSPQLILLDINMPDIDGYTLVGMIRENPRMSGVPVVAITANVMKGDREKTLSAGCDGYIEKPIDVDKFCNQIKRYLIVDNTA
ncbi:MAG: response regulator [Anaerolineae bacterium]|jgi:two-component system cell cycle response regulator DivK|nr:response regulator [Anaerolineae bacterium]